MNILYTAEAVVEGGRAGHGRTSDGRLAVALSVPKEMSGDGGPGTNPEQLFAGRGLRHPITMIPEVATEIITAIENLGEIEVLLRGVHPKESMTEKLGRMASIRQQVNRVAMNAPSPDVRRSAETLAAAGQDIYARLMKGSTAG